MFILRFSIVLLLQILDEAAVQNVFMKSLENYINWSRYLAILPVWNKYVGIHLNVL